MKEWGIHWFRRDLRTENNLSFISNYTKHKGRCLGFFCFDKDFLSRSDFSVDRFQFFLKTLEQLKNELRALGSDLLILDKPALQAFEFLFQNFSNVQPSEVTWSRDYEPFARSRDEKISKFLSDKSIQFRTDRDHLIVEPQELVKDDGSPYKVFSPYARRWKELLKSAKYSDRLRAPLLKTFESKLNWNEVLENYQDSLSQFVASNEAKVRVPIPEAGYQRACKRLKEFEAQVDAYEKQRDWPAIRGTSGISIFLKNGSLATSQVVHDLKLLNSTAREKFLNEIIWREFYYSILWHFPDVEKQSFLPQYREIKWQNNETWFQAWKEGLTGFPIVDAGMRQLKTRGWMHNRVRMIVASFLCKDLLIDYRWGEKHFMNLLLDGDLAPNNGGWQWAASTGCDPQPYFRIFNPYLQSKKFDPDGIYIKKYIPELKNIEAKYLHLPDMGGFRPKDYPATIVDHSQQRDLALKLYKSYQIRTISDSGSVI